MANTLATSPQTMADETSVGTSIWLFPDNAKVSDDAYARLSAALDSVSHYLKATNFGFTIPAGSTINGIIVDVEKKTGAASGAVDNSVKIVKGGLISGDEKADLTAWNRSDTYFSYGSASDLWGLSWTADDINASNFGFVLSGKVTLAGTGNEMSIDHIRITIYYTEAVPVVTPTARLGGGWTASGARVTEYRPYKEKTEQDRLDLKAALLSPKLKWGNS